MTSEGKLEGKDVVAIAAVVVIVLLGLAIGFKCHAGEIINAGIFVGTVTLAAVAYFQLDALAKQIKVNTEQLVMNSKQSNADFLLTFNREFFNDQKNQKIIRLIEDGESLAKNGIDDYAMDDYLGYFELMSFFEKRSVIDFNSIYEMFGHYITCAKKCEEISDYIVGLRKDREDNTYYEHFYSLAKRVDEEDKVRNGQYKG